MAYIGQVCKCPVFHDLDLRLKNNGGINRYKSKAIKIFGYQVIFMIVNGVFSAVLSNSCQKTTTVADFRYKFLKSRKMDNIDLTQQFSLSIFIDLL